jgi:hypothetical protein
MIIQADVREGSQEQRYHKIINLEATEEMTEQMSNDHVRTVLIICVNPVNPTQITRLSDPMCSSLVILSALR